MNKSSVGTSGDTVNSCSKLPINKENAAHPKRTPNVSKLPVSTRKFTNSAGSQKGFSDKKQGTGSSTKKQPLAIVNKQ